MTSTDRMGRKTYWRAEILLQIYNDKCGLEIVSRHSFLRVAKLERDG